MTQDSTLSNDLISYFSWTWIVTWKQEQSDSADIICWYNFLSFGWYFVFLIVEILIQGELMQLIYTGLVYWIP